MTNTVFSQHDGVFSFTYNHKFSCVCQHDGVFSLTYNHKFYMYILTYCQKNNTTTKNSVYHKHIKLRVILHQKVASKMTNCIGH